MLEQTVREDVPVPFDDLNGDTGPLTWGQQGIWRDMEESGLSICLSAVHALPAGTTAEDRAALLAGLVTRQPALRVRFSTDAQGNSCQVVPPSGDASLEVFRIPDDADDDVALKYAVEVMHLRRDAPLDPFRDPLLRLSLVSRDGVLLYEACTVSHLVADGVKDFVLWHQSGRLGGMRLIPRQVTEVFGDQDPAISEQGSRLADAVLEHWCRGRPMIRHWIVDFLAEQLIGEQPAVA